MIEHIHCSLYSLFSYMIFLFTMCEFLFAKALPQNSMALTSSTETLAKKFRCSHAFFIDEIASKFEKKEEISSDPFFCRQDAASPSFIADIGFGSEKTDELSAYVGVTVGDVQLTRVEFFFHDHKWRVLASQLVKESSGPVIFSRDRFKSTEEIGLHVVVAVKYKYKSPVVASTPTLKNRLSSDLLLKFDDEDDKDITFLVQTEKIKAHKVIISARCPYFKTMFQSGMEESVTNEVNVPDIDPHVFKEMLRFLYSDLAPEFCENVTAGLLAAAAKYGLKDLKYVCASTLESHLDAENVVEFLVLAETHDCCTLLEKASLVFRSHLNSNGKTERLRKLESNPALLGKLLALGYPESDTDSD